MKPAQVFVDEPRTPKGGGDMTARMFTNGDLEDLAAVVGPNVVPTQSCARSW